MHMSHSYVLRIHCEGKRCDQVVENWYQHLSANLAPSRAAELIEHAVCNCGWIVIADGGRLVCSGCQKRLAEGEDV